LLVSLKQMHGSAIIRQPARLRRRPPANMGCLP
jgi:hypothetical protein